LGFTLVELLVVIAIIGILIALLLPAIQAARNAAIRAACSNNMKNIVLSFHNHHDVHDVLPLGSRGSFHGTWAILSMPYLEQEASYSSYDFNDVFNARNNLGFLNGRRFAIFTCPADGDKTSTYQSHKLHNYLCCEGDAAYHYTDQASPTGWAIPPTIPGIPHPLITELHSAMFWSGGARSGPYKEISFNDITDGLSNTLALSETIQGERSLTGGTASRDIRGLIWYGLLTQFTTYLSPNTKQEGNDSSLTIVERDESRADRLESGFIDTGNIDRGTIHYPDHPVALPMTGNIFVAAARSFHTNGVNVGLGDGAVKFVNESINMTIWRAVGNSQGGEALSLP
jgi:prepilin-type N-terminal cleavage/methylation domain-containing protein